MHGTAPMQHKEVEVKLDLAPGSLRALKKLPVLRALNVAPRQKAEVSVYFDTDSQASQEGVDVAREANRQPLLSNHQSERPIGAI